MTTTTTRPDGAAPRALNICVFCGARPGAAPEAAELARQVGSLIGQRGHALVYGAGGSGLMGEVAWAASRNGAALAGYTPRFLYERELAIAAPDQVLHLTDDMFERKRRMVAHADAFLALPGGYGTLDEVFEVLTLNCLDVTPKPLILVDEEFWAPVVAVIDSLQRSGFAGQGKGALFETAPNAIEAVMLAELLLADDADATGPAVPAQGGENLRPTKSASSRY
ncbi:LOG family protein [Streptacidiphilus rugosus]|uniref:LOG family protein n=1 Tax=Streptacidiphilus rugosus TaxID=405783 RepID=UPI000689319E|nr:TIGR00730 family Rossman fold protein [Streptacidiphilus rugosus]